MRKIILAGIFYMLLSTAVTAQDFDFKEAVYTPRQTTFRLFAPKDAKEVAVVYDLSSDKTAGVKEKRVAMKLDKGGIWTATVKKDLAGSHYRFVVDGRCSPGVFAKAVGVNGKDAVVIDMNTTNPEGWEMDRRP